MNDDREGVCFDFGARFCAVYFALDCYVPKLNAEVLVCEFMDNWNLIKQLNIKHYATDDWKPYQKFLPKEKHLIGKEYT